jgi:hypothetical protein
MRPEPAETRFAQTVRVLLSGRLADAQRGTKGENKKIKHRFEAKFEKGD